MANSLPSNPLSRTSTQRAQWLLDFCEASFPETRGEIRKRWCHEWGEFIGRDRIPDYRDVEHAWRTINRKLKALRTTQAWPETAGAYVQLSLTNGVLNARHHYSPPSVRDRPEVHATATLLAVVGVLSVCIHCERFFLRHRRQAYCSTTCRDTANKRAYRARQKAN
jgi:hypothetical protein